MDRWWKWLLLPGMAILWFGYMFPESGVRGSVASARRARSPAMTVCYSLAFYAMAVFFILLILAK